MIRVGRQGRHAWAGLGAGPFEVSVGTYWNPRWRPVFSMVWLFEPFLLTVRTYNKGSQYRLKVKAYR